MSEHRFSWLGGGKVARPPSLRSTTALRWIAAALLLLIGGTPPIESSAKSAAHSAVQETPESAAPLTESGASEREIRLLILAVNQHRSAIGCKPLIWDERLARLARKYSETMAREGYFGHYDPAGNDPFDRMRQAGIHYRSAGENLAVGQTKGIQVYVDWMNSPAHRKIIEDCIYTHHGIGLYRNRWSYLFARY